MRIWGKILGFLFGFMLSKSLIGALLGVWLGHRFDKGLGLDFSQNNISEAERQTLFFHSTFSVMGYIAKADGQVSKQEIAFATAYMDKLGLNAAMRKQAQDAFNMGKSEHFSLTDTLQQLKSKITDRADLLNLFLEIQIQVAFADGNLNDLERSILHNIAAILGFSAKDLDNLLEMIIAGEQFHYQHQHGKGRSASVAQVDNAYKVLGVSKAASQAEIKKAYRKRMSQHHPDKLIAKGLPPEMIEAAKEKTQDIQAAYELISANSK